MARRHNQNDKVSHIDNIKLRGVISKPHQLEADKGSEIMYWVRWDHSPNEEISYAGDALITQAEAEELVKKQAEQEKKTKNTKEAK